MGKNVYFSQFGNGKIFIQMMLTDVAHAIEMSVVLTQQIRAQIEGYTA